jgi:hypothetical protein
MWITSSDDAGATWNEPRAAFAYRPAGSAGPQIVALDDGSLAVLVLRDGGNGAIEVAVVRSTDAGGPWEATVVASYTGFEDQGFLHGLAASPDGVLAAVPLGAPYRVRGPSDVFLASLTDPATTS